VTVVVRRAAVEKDAQEVVAARVIGDPGERPHLRGIDGQPVEVAVAQRLGLEGDPELTFDLGHDLIEARSAGHQDRGREPRAARIAGLGQVRAAAAGS
jgi:hypothetical protein